MQFITRNERKLRRLGNFMDSFQNISKLEPLADGLSLSRDQAIRLIKTYAVEKGNIASYNFDRKDHDFFKYIDDHPTDCCIWNGISQFRNKISKYRRALRYKDPHPTATQRVETEFIQQVHNSPYSQKSPRRTVNILSSDRISIQVVSDGSRKTINITVPKGKLVSLTRKRKNFQSFLEAKVYSSDIGGIFLIGSSDVSFGVNEIIGDIMTGYVSYMDNKTDKLHYGWMVVSSTGACGLADDPIAAEDKTVRHAASMMRRKMRESRGSN